MYLLDNTGKEVRNIPEVSTISYEESLVLQGKVFLTHTNKVLADGEDFDLSLITGASPEIVGAVVRARSSAVATFIVYEDTVFSGGVVPLTSNLDRTSAIPQTVQVLSGTSGGTSGVQLFEPILLGATGGIFQPDIAGGVSGMIRLKPSTNYTFRISSGAASNTAEFDVKIVQGL